MEINDEHFVKMEEFVCKELHNRLIDKCNRLNVDLDENDLEYFFGMFTGSLNEFKLMRGEKIQLTETAKSLKDIFFSKEKEAMIKNFVLPKHYKIPADDTIILSAGLFFGERNRRSSHQSFAQPENMTANLFPKLKSMFESFRALKPVRNIAEDIIKIIPIENGVRADVICVFCVINNTGEECLIKRVAVQFEKSKVSNCYSWNLSNLRRHVKKHVINDKKTKESIVPELDFVNQSGFTTDEITISEEKVEVNETEDFPIQNTNVNEQDHLPIKMEPNDSSDEIDDANILSLPVLDDSNTSMDSSNMSNTNEMLFKQFSSQNLRIAEAVLTNGEDMKYMLVMFKDRFMNFNVIKVDPDGNCLFSALVFQLFFVKIGSEEHKTLTATFRMAIVQFIRENIEKYRLTITDRILGDYSDKNKTVTLDECKYFIEKKLSKSGIWGGSESIIAASEKFQVNVLIFDEKKHFYFVNGFNKEYKRTIFLAYRIGAKRKNSCDVYNHYDAVGVIDEELLYKCVSILAERIEDTTILTIQDKNE